MWTQKQVATFREKLFSFHDTRHTDTHTYPDPEHTMYNENEQNT